MRRYRAAVIASFAASFIFGYVAVTRYRDYRAEHTVVKETQETDTLGVNPREVSFQSIDKDMIASFEGCDTQPYFPGGKSGPTIGYGVDLAHINTHHLDSLFSGLLPKHVIEEMKTAHGKRGADAKAWIARHRGLRITHAVAEAAFYRTCRLYWSKTLAEYQGVERLDNNAQCVVLSLVINYGPGSKPLEAMRDPIRRNDIRAMIAHMRRLEKGVSMRGLARRRQEERKVLEAVVARNDRVAQHTNLIAFD